jgi:hypothetical protein
MKKKKTVRRRNVAPKKKPRKVAARRPNPKRARAPAKKPPTFEIVQVQGAESMLVAATANKGMADVIARQLQKIARPGVKFLVV